MNRVNYLLECASEECAEVIQRISKALRFGLNEIQPGQELTNAQRLEYELHDLYAIIDLIAQEGIISKYINDEAIDAKQEKVEKYYNYSKELGVVSES